MGNNGNTKDVKLANDDDIKNIEHRDNQDTTLPIVPLSIYGIHMKVQYQQGDIIDKECTCDSKYMLLTICCVGVALRISCHWMSLTIIIYLVMDNARCISNNECAIKYTRILKDEFNVVIIHQVLRSPYTNVLDLGVWRLLQSIVERKHYMRRCNAEALCRTVMDA